jgi:hypothetical protein
MEMSKISSVYRRDFPPFYLLLFENISSSTFFDNHFISEKLNIEKGFGRGNIFHPKFLRFSFMHFSSFFRKMGIKENQLKKFGMERKRRRTIF